VLDCLLFDMKLKKDNCWTKTRSEANCGGYWVVTETFHLFIVGEITDDDTARQYMYSSSLCNQSGRL